MEVKFKKLDPKAILPAYAKPGDAAMDLTAVSANHDWAHAVYGTGLAVEIPEGYVGLLFPRSSICRVDLNLTNSVGVIDSGYRGEIKLVFRITEDLGETYHIGDRIGQLIIIPIPCIETVWADDLSTTDRGVGGFGSTGT